MLPAGGATADRSWRLWEPTWGVCLPVTEAENLSVLSLLLAVLRMPLIYVSVVSFPHLASEKASNLVSQGKKAKLWSKSRAKA